MTLLFDENLSPRLCALLSDVLPECLSVLTEELSGSSDMQLLKHAAEQGCVLVSKDSDFHERALLGPEPSKVIWLRLGNCTTEAAHLVLRNSIHRITSFQPSDDRVLELP